MSVVVSHSTSALTRIENIARAILVLRGHRVLLDAELAALYGVTTTRLNQQVRRNRQRFPKIGRASCRERVFGYV